MMPKISVVVPVYNVEEYLDECLTSLERQTVRDLEILIVDDGSTDGSAAIAQRHAAADERIRIVTRPNGGLGAARNTGIEEATGEYLAFLDSDDVLPPTAYELLLNSLERTGSDFATGNVYRLTAAGTQQAPFLARVFARDRAKTHVARFRELLSDRIVPNKLWRRDFWDRYGFRFPVGMLHEDIPVVIPAHFLARSVDVVSEPVYLYRVRESGELSITQQRATMRALTDRLTAVELAREYLVEHGPRKAHRWYEESVVAQDLRYHLDVFEVADAEYRQLFVERANAFIDRIGRRSERRLFRPLPAIDRLKYHLVRRRLVPELLEVLRFEREDLGDAAPVRERGRWFGDYPYRHDRALKVPSWIYRLGPQEMPLHARIDELRWDGDRLHVAGYAFIRGVPVDHRRAQRVSVLAVRGHRLRRLRLALIPIRFRTRSAHRPDANNNRAQASHDVSWSGFETTIRARRFKLLGRWRYGGFDVYVSARAGAIRRRRIHFAFDPGRRLRADAVALPDGTLLRAVPRQTGSIQVRIAGHWAALREHRREDGEVVMAGDLRMPADARLKFELLRTDSSAARDYPITVAGHRWEARVPVADLDDETGVPWWILVTHGSRRHRVQFPRQLAPGTWAYNEREIALRRSAQGDAVVENRRPRPVLTAARWAPESDLELEGDLHAAAGSLEFVLYSRELLVEHVFALRPGDTGQAFHARLPVTRIPSLAGELPLPEGYWVLLARPVGAAVAAGVPMQLSEELHAQLPVSTEHRHKPFALGTNRDDEAVVVVRANLGPDERGPYMQRRLRTVVYPAARTEPLRDAVVYSSFGGRQCSDSPRAIHAELVRRGAPLEHLWVVADGMAEVPRGATELRESSREHHEALARARYVVTNDHFPDWFRRRDEQVCVQTWHGTPLKRLGFDVSAMQKTIRNFESHWDERVRNWQYVISPNRFSTPILRRAYRVEGELLETGYPRIDVLAQDRRDAAGLELRRRLGIPDGVRTVLYAPTYRDQVLDRRNRYRLDLHLDLERLRAAVGEDTVILFRKHHYVVDPVPATADGFVRDVSAYPDGTELLLAADVLVTDYSSMMFDYANTGRPMLFFTYDLDLYRDEVRGFYFDFLERAPGPLLRTSDQVAEALAGIDDVREQYAARYEAFAAEFCELDDGHASARVVDRVFAGA